ncbi:PTS glucose transporter subunit IIA [Paenibacillus swuensis]|uniref:PTS glucose transporter subunit IIA n=1 Tax=Paenibacillus swuensis TaxID=1178515 RepID=A0A172TK45_9BACL|nr:glucose PTS transporter subunit IIA [Paenibacillus swuensis]ANE47435.1 PTS glucose transporter subunit IIA [Paenibacillus swuensis]
MNLMGNLQQFGRSLMMPMITLPAAAILISLANLPWAAIGADSVGHVLLISGEQIFRYLPFIFAVGVAHGLTKNASIAAMSAIIGYFIFLQITKEYVGESFHLGISGGIMIGVMSAIVYNRFKDIKLPEAIQFFGGPRFVPLVMSVASILLSALFVWIGPHMETALIRTGAWLIELGGFGTFIYGIAHRLLVPWGLHHIINNFMWFQVGGFQGADGQASIGDLPRFFAGDPSAGIYMAGLYPTMMFALPAIALAIIQEAREDLKPKVKITFLTAALASFLTGVTEPIEFAFLFVAPYLFIVHAVLSGFSMWIAYALDIHHGFSFSAGAIEYLLNLHLSHHGLWLIPIGILYGLIYYYMFRWAIRRFDIPTPGREEGSDLEEWAGDIRHRSPLILQALGGKGNIVQLEACITRLRLTVHNDRLVDMNALRHLGAAGVMRLGGGNVQVVFGTFSELIREEIMRVLQKDDDRVLFHAPLQGRMIPLSEVPDQIFARKIVGDGVAFIPEKGELVAPVSGKIAHIYPSLHALGIVTSEGLEVLLHIGIDTSLIKGKMFTAYVKEGDEVEQGQLLIRFDLQKLKKESTSTITPMVITNSDRVKSWSFAPFKAVKKGQASVMSVVLNDKEAMDGERKHG